MDEESQDYSIKKVNVTDETFVNILTMIRSGKWKQGEKLPSENDFKNMFGVSRHTIRNALNVLNMLGIIKTKQGDGNYLQELGIGIYMDNLLPNILGKGNNYQQILEFRLGIESVAAALAAKVFKDEDLPLLEQAIENCRLAQNSPVQYMEADFEFHYLIAKLSGNDILTQSMYIVKKYYFTIFKNNIPKQFSLSGNADHIAIVKAIKKHDSAKAMKCMTEHIQAIIADVTSLKES
jgi:GntR family transcriptional repressor for pyruvate dehydrogenase complex